jgi:hypothetical protein
VIVENNFEIKRNDTMMAGTHCAQCSDTRNIYIKTCDCSKNQVNQHKSTKFNSEKQQVNNISSIVDTKKQTEEPKLKAVKAIVYKVVRYELSEITSISSNMFPIIDSFLK